MAKVDGLSIKIDAKLSVSDETAAVCVTLLNMYLEENIRGLIVTENRETGLTQIEIKKNEATTE